MKQVREVALRLDQIRTIFQEARACAENAGEAAPVMEYLKTVSPDFALVAHEGAAMGLALTDLSKGASLTRWTSLLNQTPSQSHGNLHIGLGWALAHEQADISDAFAQVDRSLQFRVIDGYGYYEGIFRQRQSVRNREIPVAFQLQHEAYDQGLGRSIWFLTQGDPERIGMVVASFDTTRQSGLWRGIGTACAFSGGATHADIEELKKLSGDFRSDLAVGAAWIGKARVQTFTVTPEMEKACYLLSGLGTTEAVQVLLSHEGKEHIDFSRRITNLRAQFEEVLKPREPDILL